jgi:hypothetical protein
MNDTPLPLTVWAMTAEGFPASEGFPEANASAQRV